LPSSKAPYREEVIDPGQARVCDGSYSSRPAASSPMSVRPAFVGAAPAALTTACGGSPVAPEISSAFQSRSAAAAGAAGLVTKGAPLKDMVGVILDAAARRV